MDAIEQMLTGQMEMREFVTRLQFDPKLQNAIRQLVPQDAVNHPSHEFWTRTSYEALEENDFDYYNLLLWLCQFNNSIGDNLEVFGQIRVGYCYHHPEVHCTTKYEEAFGLYLNVIRDCFDGPEVRHVVEQIINDALPIKPKSKRIKEAKAKIEDQFHVVDKQRPRWIQGPEWPMGADSPMQYVGRKKIADGAAYSFVDVTTGASRIVEQYY